MTIEELKTKVKDESVLEIIQAMINEEKEKGVEAHRKVNKEAQALRKYKQALQDAGLSDDDDVTEFLSKMKKPKDKDEESLTLKSLKAQLDRVTQERDNEKMLSKRSKLESELTTAIGDKLYGSKYVIKSLIADNQVDIVNGEVVFKDGDELVPFNDGIAKVLDSNKEILRTVQNGGSKSTGSSKGSRDIQAIINSNDPGAIKANLKEAAAALGITI